MMTDSVRHYVSVEPDTHTITRARVVHGKRTDELALFVRDRLVGRLELDAGLAAEVCAQLHLVDKQHVVTLDDVHRAFQRALSEE